MPTARPPPDSLLPLSDHPSPCPALAALFPAGTVAAWAAVPALVDDQLESSERALVAGSTPKRRAEFGTGRLCARGALAEIGVRAPALLAGPDGAPWWPSGAVGSITHTAGCCAAVAARTAHMVGVGIDVEQSTPLGAHLEAEVCTARERAWLDGRRMGDRGTLAKLLFSVKEAFYKCQYGLTSAMLDFQDVDIDVDCDGESFRVAALRSRADVGRGSSSGSLDALRPALLRVRGTFLRDSRYIVAAASLER